MLKNNYHTHMVYCRHAEGMVEDYVNKAEELGFSELGMSDHAPILESFMTKEEYISNWGMDSMELAQVDDYLQQIEDARQKHPKLKIYSGFETEFLYDQVEYYKELSKKVDYLNLGLHFYKVGNRVINTYEDIDYSNIDTYYLALQEALRTGLYSCIVHPELYFYRYKNENGEQIFDKRCEELARKIALLAIQYDVYLEVNSNGLKYCKDKLDRSTWKYPHPRFWEIIKEYPVKIIIGADAHHPDALGNENVKLVCDFVEEIGLTIEERMLIK